jgi:hypothetical protein
MLSKSVCADLLTDGVVPKADPDISGTGVILAFVISAYITFGTVLLAYLGGLVDEDLLSPIDTKIFRIRPHNAKHATIYGAVRKAILALGDQQIVTGIAILGAGFQGLRTSSISIYHFQIVVYLAWMSSSVHLSALTLLGKFLNKHKGLLIWRLSGMLVLLVMLLVGLVPTLSNDWGIIHWTGMLRGNSGWGIPAICFWGRLWGDGISPDAVLGFFILFVSYLWKVGSLFAPVRRNYNHWVKHPFEDRLIAILRLPARKYSTTSGRIWLCAYHLLLCVCIPIFAVMEVAASFAASLWLSALGLVFGTLQVEIPRSQLLPYTGAQESSWGFGQLIPLILLVQPLGAVSERIWTSEDDDDSKPICPNQELEHRRASEPSRTPPGTLLHALADEGKVSSMLFEQREHIKSILYESRLFSTLVWIVQVALLFSFTIVFWFDAETIGYTRTHNWALIFIVIGSMIGIGVITTLFFGPFSRLGRSKLESRLIEDREKEIGPSRGPASL